MSFDKSKSLLTVCDDLTQVKGMFLSSKQWLTISLVKHQREKNMKSY